MVLNRFSYLNYWFELIVLMVQSDDSRIVSIAQI